MVSKDMYTIKAAAVYLGINVNTFRYWLKKNSDECENGTYETRLLDLTTKIKMPVRSKNHIATRNYERYIILDMDEFQAEFEKYINFMKARKKRKRKGRLIWTETSVECYKNNLICKNCIYKKICLSIIKSGDNTEPPMKKFVRKLLIELGLPPIN